jgi:AcrR family transcriptional regulator
MEKKISKEDIITAVEKLIATRGVNDFSLKDIADELHISKGTLYYHYQSKDDLVLDIIKKHMSELDKEYLDWLSRHKGDIITKERFLNVIFYKGVRLFNKAKIHLYIINECLKENPSLKTEYTKMWKSWQDQLKLGLEQVFPECPDKDAYAYLLMLIIDGLTIQVVLESSPVLDERLVPLVIKAGEK